MEREISMICDESDIVCAHLCFKQAQPKMGHSPKVDDGVDIFFKTF